MSSVYLRRHVLLLVPLGFASGLPYLLVGSTLAAWLTQAGVPLGDLGLFSIVALPYSLKLLWAPLVDRFALPFLGRRRGWLVAFQLALVAALLVLGSVSPRAAPVAFAALSVAVTVLAASQDLVVDAYRTDLLAADERAAGTALFVLGYRLAMLVSGGAALIAADHLPFGRVYQGCATLLGIGVVAALAAPEPPAVRAPATLRAAVVAPLTDWFARPGAVGLLAFILVYRLADLVVAAMSVPFLLHVGFSNTAIGLATKTAGMAATIAGALGGGAIVARRGLQRPLVTFGIASSLSTLAWAALALAGKRDALMLVVVGVHYLLVGAAIAAVEALLLTCCNRRYGATQYALLASVAGLGGRVAAAGSGYTAAAIGWPAFFTVAAAVGVAGIVVTARWAAASTGSATDRDRSP
jgi:MFS transporter, PAT family, beta-lactamase induction signal transducer AmpG